MPSRLICGPSSASRSKLDLDTENASAALLTRTQHLDIGIAVLSAGIFTSGPFVGNTLADETRVLTS
jgi:hypothetical protein